MAISYLWFKLPQSIIFCPTKNFLQFEWSKNKVYKLVVAFFSMKVKNLNFISLT